MCYVSDSEGPHPYVCPLTLPLSRLGYQPIVSRRLFSKSVTLRLFVNISAFCNFVLMYCNSISLGLSHDQNQCILIA